MPRSGETNSLMCLFIFTPTILRKVFYRAIYWKFVKGLYSEYNIFIGFLFYKKNKNKEKVHSVQMIYL